MALEIGKYNVTRGQFAVFVEATAHRDTYFRAPEVQLFLWLRGVVSNKLLETHRHHLGTQMRDVKRERPLDDPRSSNDTSAALCAHLTAGLTRPSVAAVRGEVVDLDDARLLSLGHEVPALVPRAGVFP